MPRVSIGTAERAARAAEVRAKRYADERREKNEALSRLLRAQQYGMGLTMEQTAQMVGINFRTYAKYLNEPDLMPMGILRKLLQVLKVRTEDVLPLIPIENMEVGA